MGQSDHSRRGRDSILIRIGAVLGLLLAVCLASVAPALASYEQVADFGKNELLRATQLAVNINGTGGVPAGTVYAVRSEYGRVARYGPDGDFQEAWGWGVGNDAEEFQRCGPAAEGLPGGFPTCYQGSSRFLPRGEGPGQLENPIGVAVEQSTGRVYVLDNERKNGVIQVFSAEGAPLSSFGESGVFGESFAEGPAKLHQILESGLAVGDGGLVYVTDGKSVSAASGRELRVMVFENGVYTGRDHDVAPYPAGPEYITEKLALDSSGNLYSGSEKAIYEFAPGAPLAPICKFLLPAGGIQGFTVDPATGAPFYFQAIGNEEVHQLTPCNSRGEFTEVQGGNIKVTPSTPELDALAFNPDLVYENGRPPGVLYGADGAELSITEKGIGHIFAQPVSRVPGIETESVSRVGVSSAVLEAGLDPNGENTGYVFQYETEAAYQANEADDRFAGASDAPVGGGGHVSGVSVVPVSVTISGLAPDTTYRFRVLASDADGSSEGDPESLRTYPGDLPLLPDGRAYELVSPIEKHGGEPFPLDSEFGSCGNECKPGVGAEIFPRRVSADGDAIVYSGFSFNPAEGASVYNEYHSERTSTGWKTQNLSPALMGSSLQGYRAFNSDLSEGVLKQFLPSLTPSAPSEYSNLYLQPSGDPGSLTPLLTEPPLDRPSGAAGEFQMIYGGSSADFSRFFFAANDALPGVVPAAVDGGPGKDNLYESADGTLRLVNVLPGGDVTVPGAYFGSKYQTSHAISSDGSRVFWSSESGQVYVRKDGLVTEEVLDATGRFLTASADGSRVLLTDGLEYDVDDLGEAPVDLSEGKGGFVGLVGQSEDLSTVYFIDTAVLTSEPNGQGAVAQSGGDNLYVRGEGGAAVFVATLTHEDGAVGTSGSVWDASPPNRLAQASPDGRWVAFLSSASLIDGFDNIGPCHLVAGTTSNYLTSACAEVYLYDSVLGTLTCPSCNPTGEAPHGPSMLPLIGNGGGHEPQPQSFYLSDVGRLFFDSQDSLSPRDTNGNVEDVYESVPDGVGGCERDGGCVSLISSGHGPDDSDFLATDPSGENVFFTTRDRLLPADKDNLVDVYDARQGGGIGGEVEGVSGGCSGEACQGAPPSTPPESVPGSFAFSGTGNLLAPPAPTTAGRTKPKAKALTRAQLLTRALRACKHKPKRGRVSCEKTAHKRYGVKVKSKGAAKARAKTVTGTARGGRSQ